MPLLFIPVTCGQPAQQDHRHHPACPDRLSGRGNARHFLAACTCAKSKCHPLKIPAGRRGMPLATHQPPPVRPPWPPSYFQMRQHLEAAERDPAWAFAPPHAGQRVTAQRHPPQGSSGATITHSDWLRAGTDIPGAALSIHRTPGALTGVPNEIKLLRCFCLISGQPCVSLA